MLVGASLPGELPPAIYHNDIMTPEPKEIDLIFMQELPKLVSNQNGGLSHTSSACFLEDHSTKCPSRVLGGSIV